MSKDTQDRRCFCAAEVYEQCPDFESARARAIGPPVFDGTASATSTSAVPAAPERHRHRARHKRRRRSPAQKWWEKNRGALLVTVCWLALALVACWLVWRSR